MEWMLQVLDEVDDAIGALRFCCAGFAAEIGLVAAGGLGESKLAGGKPAVDPAPL